MPINGPWYNEKPKNDYLYNGMEYNTDLGLNWSDYGARWYDPATARWSSVDPLAEKYVGHSPYNYVLGNPVKYIDPDGRWVSQFDLNNNLILVKERGDNFQTLQKFIGRENGKYFGYQVSELWELFQNGAENGTVNLGNDNHISQTYSLLKSLENGEVQGALNCFDCSDYNSQGKVPPPSTIDSYITGVYDNNYDFRRDIYANYYEDVRGTAELMFGKGVANFGSTYSFLGFELSRSIKHAATFLGTGADGTNYYFSKNGFLPSSNFGIFTEQQLINIYGGVIGYDRLDSGYYNYIE